MSKQPMSLEKVVSQGVEVLRSKLPGASIEVAMNPEPGVDAWVWILLDPAARERFSQVRAVARKELAALLEESNFNIIPIVDQKEPVHG
jgi:hypothetical protein